MTAEIAVMNRSGIALAADSAVTITTGAGQKIYNTVNKLFTLSKYEPVAVMVYGNAELMGVPWELIIKVYRKSLGDRSFSTIAEAAEDLLGWIESNQDLFPERLRRDFAMAQVGGMLASLVRTRIDDGVRSALEEADGAGINHAQVKAIVADAIKHVRDQTNRKDKDARFTKPNIDAFVKLLDFDSLIAEVLDSLPLGPTQRNQIRAIARNLAGRIWFSESHSGLVVAGYGTSQVYPAVSAYQVEGILGRRIKAVAETELVVGETTNGGIIPFAQREMVDTFMSGISPEMQEGLRGYLDEFFEQLPDRVAEGLEGLSAKKSESVVSAVAVAGAAARNDLAEALSGYQHDQFIVPVMAAIEVLPKEDLADVAESLVNLTSFKRRVSIREVETVGGPIDVAIISRGDGLVWIKRKHYFKPDLNPQFFANYNRSTAIKGNGT